MSVADPTDPIERALLSIDRKLALLLWVEAAIAGILASCAAVFGVTAAVVLGLRLRRRAPRAGD